MKATLERRSRRPGEHPSESPRDRGLVLLEQALERPGRPLEPALREEMEARFGRDLRHVRVHTHERAQAAAEALDAHALTVGDHIVFGSSRYDPGTVEGRMLLAHELAHVVRADTPLADGGLASAHVLSPREATTSRHGPTAVVASEAHLRPLDEVGAAEELAARDLAARALAGGVEPGALSPAPPGRRGEIACFLRGQPLAAALAPVTDSFVETIACDVARSLERDPDQAATRVRRRIARLPETTRAAVVSRVQELLTPTQRERAAEALTGAALGDREAERARPPEEDERRATAAEAELRQAEREEAEREEAEREEAEREAEEGAEERAAAAAGHEEQREREEGAAEAEREGVAEPSEPRPETTAAPPLEAHAEVSADEGAAAEAAQGEAEEPVAREEGRAGVEEPAAGARAATAEAGGPPAAAETAPGGEPNLAAMVELERRVEEEGTREEEAAREQELAAAALDSVSPVPPRPAAAEPAEAPEPLEEPAEDPAAEEPTLAEPSEEPPAAPEEPSAAEAEALPAEAASAEAAVAEEEAAPSEAELPPTPEELALAELPEPAPPPGPADVGRAPAGPDAAGAAEVSRGMMARTVSEPSLPDLAESEGESGAAAEAELQVSLEAEAEAIVEPTESASPADAPAEAAAGAEATGDCGPDVGGAGGGGAAVEDRPAPEPPDVSEAEPAAAMAAIGSLPPVAMGQALAGVSQAASRQVGEGRADLAGDPPSLERPAGSPETRPAGAIEAVRSAAATTTTPTPARVEAAPAGGPGTAPTTEPLPSPPPPPTQAVSAPAVGGGAQREVTAADAQALRASLDTLPVTDPALAVTAGLPPTVSLDGDADPAQVRGRRDELDEATHATQAEGRRDATAPQGEADIFPSVEPETLRAAIPGAEGAGPAAVPLEESDEATAIIAREEHAAEARGAASRAQSQMVADRESHDADVAEERDRARAEMDDLVRENAEEQESRRQQARDDVRDERAKWREEQDAAVEQSRVEADAEGRRASAAIETERQRGDRDAAGHIERGNDEAAEHRREAERDARVERDRGRRESSGVLGWLADRARAFFDGIKRAIQQVFEAARAAVRRAIETAQRLATEVIDRARRAVVAVIEAAGAALVAIADTLLAAFPELRDRFVTAIQRVVDAAVEAVNRLAEALKDGIVALLDALGSVLEGLLTLLERAYLAAIDLVASAVQGIVRAAQAVVQALGDFAQLIVDVAASPAQWLRNLGASVVDGIRNHLWNSIKCAVKGWFDSKVDAVVGLGRTVWDVLRRGGIRFAEIGRMVWQAIVASLPGIVIQLAIEKLVSLVVPAATAVKLIIDGLRAAWGAMSRIIAAFEAFFRFLKAVKSGNAGREFATAVAAGAVALVDFLSKFLVERLGSAARGVAGRIAALARRIGERLRRVGQAAARASRRAVSAVRRAGTRAAGAVRAAARGAAGAARTVAHRAVQVAARLGRRAARGVGGAVRMARAAWQRARGAWRNARARVRRWREARRQRVEEHRRRRQRRGHERLDRAVRELRPRVASLIERGASRPLLWVRLRAWQMRYRLSSLRVVQEGASRVAVRARVNPTTDVVRQVIKAMGRLLHERIRLVWPRVLRESRIRLAVERLREERARSLGRTPGRSVLMMDPSEPVVAGTLDVMTGSLVGVGSGARVIPAGTRQTIISTARPGGIVVSEQWLGAGAPFQAVVAVRPHSYVELGNIAAGRARPPRAPGAGRIPVADTHQALGQLLETGTLPPGLPRSQAKGAGPTFTRRQVAAIARLMLQVEAGRDPGAFVTMQMLGGLLRHRRISPEQALTTLNQMSVVGAADISRRVSGQLNIEPQSLAPHHRPPIRRPDPGDVTVFLEREREAFALWVTHRMTVEPYFFRSVEGLDRFLRREGTEWLIDHVTRGTLVSGP
jgi:hypothetical protein